MERFGTGLGEVGGPIYAGACRMKRVCWADTACCIGAHLVLEHWGTSQEAGAAAVDSTADAGEEASMAAATSDAGSPSMRAELMPGAADEMFKLLLLLSALASSSIPNVSPCPATRACRATFRQLARITDTTARLGAQTLPQMMPQPILWPCRAARTSQSGAEPHPQDRNDDILAK